MTKMTKEKVKNAITKLENINPNDEYAYEKAILAYLTIGELPVLPLCAIPTGETIFRTRINEAKSEGFFSKISDVAIAPRNMVKNFARCNRPFQSKFYCSENRPTSFGELVDYWAENKKTGERIYVTIGEWKLKNPLKAIFITTPDKNDRILDFDKEYGTIIDNCLDNCDLEVKEAMVVLYRYLFEKFRKRAKQDLKTYAITTAYCNLALSLSGGVNSIFFPSVELEKGRQGMNLAINEDFATFDNLELKQIIRYELCIIGSNENGEPIFRQVSEQKATEFDIINNIIEWK